MATQGLQRGLHILDTSGFAVRAPEMPTVLESPYAGELIIGNRAHTVASIQQDVIDNPGSGGNLENLGPRFSEYVWPDPQRFVEFFGADVVPSLHGAYQALTIGHNLLGHSIADGYTLSRSEQTLFMIFMTMHDGHEGDVALLRNEMSDTPNERKSKDQEFAEFTSNRNYVSALLGVRYDDPILDSYDDFLGVNTSLDPNEVNHQLYSIWFTTEHLGYLATGLQGLDISLKKTDISRCERDRSLALAADALRWNIPVLNGLDAAKKYEYAEVVLNKALAAVPLVAARMEICDHQFFDERIASLVTRALREID